ncbi:MAG: 16S rRNA (cytosine(1402)-N(4))-methyltransferase RsmH [Candidatus Doudnabacteria bacterium]|nr:16S rRNA (cytosine(1402)-N(4))-methyltransferase RsmH [Candidatus Doudnabacteria bacterium]
MIPNSYKHTPVLLQEVLEYLQPKVGEVFIDATLGGGGYTEALLGAVASTGKVLSLDLDIDAIRAFKLKPQTSNLKPVLVQGNFKDIASIAQANGFSKVNGVVADIGLSSYELDDAGRGISFKHDEPLDMRFDASVANPTAADLLAFKSEVELTKLFTEYGEERYSRSIARNIVRKRTEEAVTRTTQLVDIITNSLPRAVRHKAQDSCRRIFQALRIAVNGELENLRQFLPDALGLLAPGGRLVVVVFHSLEDRIVKQFFVQAATGCVCPANFPHCVCGKTPQVQILTRRPVSAGEAELAQNSRSRPAKLRAVLKL